MAEAAFQDQRWRGGLEPLSGLAQLRIVQATVDADIARERFARRSAGGEHARGAHADDALLEELETGKGLPVSFDRLSIQAPSIVVDTIDGYDRDLADIIEFINEGRRSSTLQ